MSLSRCLPARSDPPKRLDQLALAGFPGIFLQHFGNAEDGVERRAQLVAHAGEELALGLGRRHGLVARDLELRLVALELADVGVDGDRAAAG